MSHDSYLAGVVEQLEALNKSGSQGEVPAEWLEVALELAELDLDPVDGELARCYASLSQGKVAPKPPKDPPSMLRSLVLGVMLDWADPHMLNANLTLHPLLAIIAGWKPGHLPGVTTYYNFLARIEAGPYDPKARREPRSSTTNNRGRFSRKLKEERKSRKEAMEAACKEVDTEPVGLEVKYVLARRAAGQGPQATLAARLNAMLGAAVVRPSGLRGLLGASGRVSTAIDGSLVDSAARGRGRKACGCPRRAPCDHDQGINYTDPSAQWTWDHYRRRWMFGHKLMLASTTYQGVELPLALQTSPANFHDSVLAPVLLEMLDAMFSGSSLRLSHAIMDMGFDAAPLYHLVSTLGATPIIPLHPNAKPLHSDGDQTFNESGVPLCKGGIPMTRHGKSPNGAAVMFNCPAKYAGREDGKVVRKVDLGRCPLGSLCDPESKMGPMVHVDLEKNGRLSPLIPRDSERFKELYKQRTVAERMNAHLKGRIGERPYRRESHLAIWTFAWALSRHAHAWRIDEFGAKGPTSLADLIDHINKLRDAREVVAMERAEAA